ncbi:MAG TPA: hypothetical protein VIL34_03590 [Actinopolymorphaceae bacterium]|jgi:hypothetical protein
MTTGLLGLPNLDQLLDTFAGREESFASKPSLLFVCFDVNTPNQRFVALSVRAAGLTD